MMRLSDDTRLLRDMQEHPERYTDEQLEAMMTDLDREPDAEAAWQRLHPSLFTIPFTIRKVAAVAAIALAIGVGGAALRFTFTSVWQKPEPSATQEQASAPAPDAIPVDTLYRFADVRLDSILLRVSRHYGREVVFRDTAVCALRLYTTWNSTQPLADFVEMLGEFDQLSLTEQGDTLYVQSAKREEDR